MAMAQLCSESPGWTMSPRISFSHDVPSQPDALLTVHHRSDSSFSDSASDFRFDVGQSLEEESCTADELFSDGKILPFLPRSNSKDASPTKPPSLPFVPPPPPSQPLPKKESLREIMAAREQASDAKPATTSNSKSFWGFKRSSSLNSGTGLKRSLIYKLPLLNRSNSTGSVSQDSKKETSKPTQKPKHFPSTPTSSSSHRSPPPPPPPPSKKREKPRAGAYGSGGVRISPVLNVPPPYISSGTTNLFGFGYFLRAGRDSHKAKKRST